MMKIIDTFDNLINSIPNQKKVALVGMQPKTVQELHAGHIACIDKAKTVADIILVMMWNDHKAQDTFYGRTQDYYAFTLRDDLTNQLDASGVDILYSGTEDDSLAKFTSIATISDTEKCIESIMSTEGYTTHKHDLLKYILSMQTIAYQQGLVCDRVACWADGYWRFHQKHYIEKYTDTTMHLIDPVRDSYGNILRSSKITGSIDIHTPLMPDHDISDQTEMEQYVNSLNIQGLSLERFDRCTTPDSKIYLWALFRYGYNEIGFEEARII
jgi:hypothetical protein